MSRAPTDVEGRRFGRLFARHPTDERGPGGDVVWLCECTCQKRTKVKVTLGNLLSNNTVSCGCKNAERGHVRFNLYTRLRRNGLSFEKIGKKCGVTKQAVHRCLTRHKEKV